MSTNEDQKAKMVFLVVSTFFAVLLTWVVLTFFLGMLAAADPSSPQRTGSSGSMVSGDEARLRVDSSAGARPSVYVVTSESCGACKKFAPTVDRAARASSVPFVEANLSAGSAWVTDLVRAHGVTAVPTLLRFDGNGGVAKYAGDRSISSVMRFAETGRS